MVMWYSGNQHNNLQRRGSNLNRLSKVHIFSCRIPLRSVGTRWREELKCQKNGTVVGKFYLEQAEVDAIAVTVYCQCKIMTGRCEEDKITRCTAYLQVLRRFGNEWSGQEIGAETLRGVFGWEMGWEYAKNPPLNGFSMYWCIGWLRAAQEMPWR